jgi:ABC-type uncharacterized transport system ATPase component
MEFQSFSNRSDVIISGISCQNSQMFFTGVIGGNGTTISGSANTTAGQIMFIHILVISLLNMI